MSEQPGYLDKSTHECVALTKLEYKKYAGMVFHTLVSPLAIRRPHGRLSKYTGACISILSRQQT